MLFLFANSISKRFSSHHSDLLDVLLVWTVSKEIPMRCYPPPQGLCLSLTKRTTHCLLIAVAAIERCCAA